MKSFFLCVFTCFVLCNNSQSQAQWTWLNPTPSGYIAVKTLFTDSKNGFILNANGDLQTTNDLGEHWQFRRNFSNAVNMDYKDSLFIISGHNSVYTSRDNGISWTSLKAPEADYLRYISILNRSTFFLSTRSGHVYKTVNAGLTWINLNIGEQVFAMQFTDIKTGYAGGNGGRIIKTSDGGNTWTRIKENNLSNNFTLLQFFDSTRGFAFRENNTMFSTSDGGKTWDSANVFTKMNAIYFTDYNTGYFAGESGVISKTIDGGKSWAAKGIDGGYARDLYSIYFLSADTGFAVGAMGRILKTTDGGNVWIQYSPTYMDFSSIHLPALNIGYAPIKDSIYKTVDNGITWKALNFKAVTSNFTSSQFGIAHFFSADTGFIFETGPLRICNTNDGGATWTTRAPFYYMIDEIIDLNFYNDSSAYGIFSGSPGRTLMRTVDRGNTWTEVTAINNLKKTFFLDGKNGFGLGYQNITKTTDSGKTWTPFFISDFGVLNGIWFTDRATGFVAGNDGFIGRSIDSGKTWKKVEFPQFIGWRYEILSVKFFNKNIGYAAMDGGIVLKTITGGKTWKNETVLPYYNIKDIAFGKDSTVYVTGNYGSILKNMLAGFQVDSLKSVSDAYCKYTLSALVASTLKPVDSIFFEYGVGNFNNSIKATPATVMDSSVWVSAVVDSLASDSLYSMRLKIYFDKQVYYYSEEYSGFRPSGPPKPIITAQDKILTSSADSGNQWYLNGTAIPGATGKQYTATVTGQYRVTSSINNCLSKLSDPYNLVVTATIDIFTLNGGVKVFPNPVNNQLFIKSNSYRQLKIRLVDVYGHLLLEKDFNGTSNVLPVSSLSSGIYMLYINDPVKKESGCLKIIKQ